MLKNLKRDSKQVFILDHKVWALRRHSYIEKLWLTIIKWRSHFVLGVVVLGVAFVALSLLPVTERATPNGPRHRDSGLPGQDISFNIMKVFLDSLTHLEEHRLTSWSRSSHQEQPRWWQLLQTPSVERNKLKYFKIVSLSDAAPAPLGLASFFSLDKSSWVYVCTAR